MVVATAYYSQYRFSIFSGRHLSTLINSIIKVNWKTLASEVGVKEEDISRNCKLDENTFR